MPLNYTPPVLVAGTDHKTDAGGSTPVDVPFMQDVLDAVKAVSDEVDSGGGIDERIRDTIGAALVAGDNVTITPNDAGDIITIASTGGDSAYEIAVANGFVGTESEWLDSLEGAPGPTGPAGLTGAPGSGGGTPTFVRDIRHFLIGAETLDPTGVASIQTVLQRAVDALTLEYDALSANIKPSGFQIYFPEGYYKTGTINWKRGVGIKGQSRRVVFLPTGTFIVGTSPVGYDYTDCYFEDFTIDGSAQTSGSYTTNIKGIFIKRLIRSRFERVIIRNTWATGFGVDYLQDVSFTNCEADNCGRGLAALGTAPTAASGHSGFGIGTGDFTMENVTIIGCVARNCGLNGFFTEELGSGSRNRGFRLIGSVAYGNYIGMKDCGSLGPIITGNQFLNNTFGVSIAETILTPLGGKDGILADNVIAGNGVGVLVGDGGPYSIRGNEISNNTGIGISFVAEGGAVADRNTIENNRIHDNGGVGINIARDLTRLVVRNNSMWSNTGGNLNSTGLLTTATFTGNDGEGGVNVVRVAGETCVAQNRGFDISAVKPLGAYLAEQNTDTPLVQIPMSEVASPVVDRKALVTVKEFAGVTPGTWGVGQSSTRFDGVTGYMLWGRPASLDSLAAFTVEAIIRPDALSAGVVASRDNNTVRGWLMRVHTDGKLQLFKGTAFTASTAALTTGQVVHVAGVYDGANVTVYVNGVATGTPTAATGVTGNPPVDNALGVRYATGSTPDTLRFNGVMAGFAIYPTALSGARLLVHAQAAGLA